MKKLATTALMFSTILLIGCESVDHSVPGLTQAAYDSLEVNKMPNNCQKIGEVTGFDKIKPNERDTDIDTLKEGALNDLKNKAAQMTYGSRPVIQTNGIEISCTYNGKSLPCKEDEVRSGRFKARSVTLTATVFSCSN
ncbi:MAG: DUF4156 domain-containing protein [Neisseriaceae bacterium]|nr:DUF4156 domain-containing protein [Neisseriaceae bacterium]